MSETTTRRWLVKRLKRLHAVPIENVAGVGTPDINYNGGWIELKYLPKWPARPTTPVRVRKFKPAQRDFLRDRCRAGGRAYLLLRVGSWDWVLLWGETAAEHLDRVDRDRLESIALHVWREGIDVDELAIMLNY